MTQPPAASGTHPPKPSEAATPRKRRGRPRSPVFAHFRRLVDQNGLFVGNACQFCSFVSRDRSENPTYLTRHILRTCSAPQQVKDAMGVRHPSIAITSYGNGNRFSGAKGPLPQSASRQKGPVSSVAATPVTLAAEKNGIRAAKKNFPESSQQQSQLPDRGDHQQQHSRRNQAAEREQVHLRLAGQTVHNFNQNDQTRRDFGSSHVQLREHHAGANQPMRASGHQMQHSEQLQRQGIGDGSPSVLVHHGANQQLLEENVKRGKQIHESASQRHQRQQQQMQNIPQSQAEKRQQEQPVAHLLHLQQQQQRQTEPERGQETQVEAVPVQTNTPPFPLQQSSTHVMSASPSATPPRRPGSVQTVVRPVGVTKSRRGRPRSPALVHFRRHIDETGAFIANQCIHCSFVSRDRSENSTLLLRHLLSKACNVPENIRIVLRGNRYDADGKRTYAPGSKNANQKLNKKMLAKSSDAKQNKDKKAILSRGYSANPQLVSKALVRFFSEYDLDLAVVDAPAFKTLARALSSTASDNGVVNQSSDRKSTDAISELDSEAVVGLLPTQEILEAYWRETPIPHLLSENPSNRNMPSVHLLIHFPICAFKGKNLGSTTCYGSVLTAPHGWNPALIASIFRWSSNGRLRYIGSKNCNGDLVANVTAIVEENRSETSNFHSELDHIFISRPFRGAEKTYDIPRQDPLNVWVPDVAREVDILCQELLAQVPFLVRCVRRNKLLAWFFGERYSERAAAILFGQNIAAKQICQQYFDRAPTLGKHIQCRQVLETAVMTYEVLSEAQSIHENPQRLQETGSFLRSLNEDNSGSAKLFQEIVRLVLSVEYRNELKAFISIISPLADLISKYSPSRSAFPDEEFCRSQATKPPSDPFSKDNPFRGRSISYLLPDSVEVLRELYSEKMQEYDSDLRVLRGHTACRLLGKGADGYPPIVDDICYVAAFLNPGANLSTKKGISVEEAWRRAVAFLHTQYSSNTEISLERVLEQLQSFHRRSGVFSVPEIFGDAGDFEDPRYWWEKHGSLAPELYTVAAKVLRAPTTTFPVVQYISEMNAREAVLMGPERDETKEKKRMVGWNLRLTHLDAPPKSSFVTLKDRIDL